MIAILDYGAGNLRSVENTLAEIGAAYTLVRDAGGLRAASKIILPGVGHFGQMMRALDRMQVRDALLERIRADVPFLGICLGLQALFERSEEAPDACGLGLYAGTVRRFPAEARVPHILTALHSRAGIGQYLRRAVSSREIGTGRSAFGPQFRGAIIRCII